MSVEKISENCILLHKQLDDSQCVALLENKSLSGRLSKADLVLHILGMICGFESHLFVWDGMHFKINHKYAMRSINSEALQRFLRRFTSYGRKFRLMFEFTENQFYRGQTFDAFQNALKVVLIEIMQTTLEIRAEFESHSPSDKDVRLVLIEHYLDSEKNGFLLLTLRNLYSLYVQIKDLSDHSESLSKIDSLSSEIFINRKFFNQILNVLHKHLIIPDNSIRNLAIKLFFYILKPMFNQIQTMLRHFSSVSELQTNEFLFSSKFLTNHQMLNIEYFPQEISFYWRDIIYIDHQFSSSPLFRSESLKLLAEALKCCLATKINHNGTIASISTIPLNIEVRFWKEIFELLQIDCESNDLVRTESDQNSEPISLAIVSKLFNSMFSKTMLDMHQIFEKTMNESFRAISEPIIDIFMLNFRQKYLQLFEFHTNFFLVQNAEHIFLYMHHVFPGLRQHLLLAKEAKSFAKLEHLVRDVHKKFHDPIDPNQSATGLKFFLPKFFLFDMALMEIRSECDWIIKSFDYFHFQFAFKPNTTGFDDDEMRKLPNIWPLDQMFNSRIVDLFNESLQFLLRLRYFQFIIGNDFLISSKFRYNDLNKNIYLFRFRLANLIFQFGRQIEYRLNELLHKTHTQLKQAKTMKDLFDVHQKFLEKLQQINSRIMKSDFIHNQFRTIAKFCHSELPNRTPINKFTESSIDKNRKISMWKNFDQLDLIQQEDFNF
ncbi:hypothetical protein SSS_09681 [Sarcoptes scabiei]|uniref:Gamma tubulin complex component protein N-terminal domain-containing protein n=1 Tax=Sarcoptes scabiei TaxID=52283 RepID=A0A834RGI8_SARSC|nr:hypothetical protein SSS_09681 [Sarcoptes scabiei]